MRARVLIVDDSGFFRRRLTEIIGSDPQLEVVGTAENGQEAISKVAELKPDVVTMDIEMPVMDGITAVRRLMASNPVPVLMFSSLTTEGARATLDALEAGAMDFLPKSLEDIARDRIEATKLLLARIKALATRAASLRAPKPAPAPVVSPPVRRAAAAPAAGRYQLLAIGASTGGPVALQEVLKVLPEKFPVPIVLVQHMPASFTGPFAARLDQLCKVKVKEAAEGDVLAPGQALLAPGGKQMTIESKNGAQVVRLREAQSQEHYKPSVDIAFQSIAKCCNGKVLAVVLTGMGADGREGARALKQRGSTIWAQDEKSCVVYGMPAAVAEAGLADQVLPLAEIGPHIAHDIV
jgi:two-component system chemotaxis response regulator CheB